MSLYIYAETAFHHEGDMSYMTALIDAAKRAGVQGIKFQVLIDLDRFMSRKHTAYDKVRTWLFNKEEWGQIFAYAYKAELDIVMMPLDPECFDLLSEPGLKYLDIHSVSFHDQSVLTRIKQSQLPVILGIGGRTLEEIDEKVSFFAGHELILMHGFQSYPSELKNVKLKRISALAKKYPGLAIGYADHTHFSDEMGVKANDIAYALGARYFEKHLSLAEGVQRVDYEAAVGEEKLARIVSSLNLLEQAIGMDGDDVFEMTEAELKYRAREKYAVANKDLPAGICIAEQDIEFKMTDQGIGFTRSIDVVGRALSCSIEKDQLFIKEMFT